MKPKILFALHYRRFEEVLEKELKNQYEFVGSASYREVIVDKVRQTNPDILLIREAIPGTKGIVDIIYTIRNNHKNVRIIFMTGRREPGDMLLADLVSFGVYDIITSESIPKKEVVRLIRHPQSFDDVSYLLPKPNRDESSTHKAFDVQTRIVEKEVTKVVEVEKDPEPTPSQGQSEKEPEPSVEEPKEISNDEPPAPRGLSGALKEMLKKKKDEPEISPMPAGVPALPPAPPTVGTSVQESPSTEQLAMPPMPTGMIGSKNNVVQSKQIISFIGAVNGVGNTQVAFNTAVKLAQEGHRVVFLELNPNFSTIDTSFQLGDYQRGLDKALDSLASNQQKDAMKSIIKMEDVQKQTKSTNAMSKNYRKMPSTLDFLLFSQDYQTLVVKPKVDYTKLKDLCMILLLQENYDYVVVDSEPLGKQPELVQDLSSISSKVFVTLTQETAQIGHVTRNIIELNKRINIEDKLYYILNKETDCELDKEMIEDWLDTSLSVVVPDAKSQFSDASFLGIPFVLHSKHQGTQQAFENLKIKIQQS